MADAMRAACPACGEGQGPATKSDLEGRKRTDFFRCNKCALEFTVQVNRNSHEIALAAQRRR